MSYIMDLQSIVDFLVRLPVDVVILLSFTLLIAIDALRSGAGRATVLAIAFPLTAFLYGMLSHVFFLGPFMEKLTIPHAHAGMLGVLFIITFFLVYRMMFSVGTGSIAFSFSLLAGIAAVIAVLVVWLQVPALGDVWHFGPSVQMVFGQAYALYWLLVSYLLLAFIRS